jgi:hypothetical protein
LQRIQNKKYTYNAKRAHAFTLQEMEDLDHIVSDYKKKSRSISITKLSRKISGLAQSVMPVCTASYMMAGYGHAHHVF